MGQKSKYIAPIMNYYTLIGLNEDELSEKFDEFIDMSEYKLKILAEIFEEKIKRLKDVEENS